MTGFQVYSKYIAIKLHFEKDSYDYFTYGCGEKTKVNLSTFEKRYDRFKFEKIAAKIASDEVETFLIAAFVKEGIKFQQLVFEELYENFIKFSSLYEKTSYALEEDLKIIEELCKKKKLSKENFFLEHTTVSGNKKHSEFVKCILGEKVSLTSSVLIGTFLNLFQEYDTLYDDDPVWTSKSKIIFKFVPFFIKRLSDSSLNKYRKRIKTFISCTNDLQENKKL